MSKWQLCRASLSGSKWITLRQDSKLRIWDITKRLCSRRCLLRFKQQSSIHRLRLSRPTLSMTSLWCIRLQMRMCTLSSLSVEASRTRQLIQWRSQMLGRAASTRIVNDQSIKLALTTRIRPMRASKLRKSADTNASIVWLKMRTHAFAKRLTLCTASLRPSNLMWLTVINLLDYKRT